MRSRMWQLKWNCGTGASLFALVASVGAQEQPTAAPTENNWTFSVTPYLWMAGQSGTIRVGQVIAAQNVNAHFSNIWHNLNFGAMGTFEARKGRWGIIVDGFYVSVSKTSDPILGGRLGTAKLQLDNGVLQVAGAYRVLDSDTTPIDVLAGLRYTNLNTTLSFSPSALLPAGVERGRGVSWVDGLVGVRATYRFSEKWSVTGYADVGAGGSNFAWQLVAAAFWDVTKSVNLAGGYRILTQDYNSSSFYYNIRTAGPFAGVRIRF
ncbi:hypothetical protein LMG28138_05987 [Pararobbsia alpina]|uniref:Outer membrane protein beta-barrel domain-containing protein n=2 Tax=Pararobbsia alpina TaxID=621374 RepID=A0A6S7D621_9BURK|nr:hypothetical protein LMG28138_05987 [Pararobbsia alpina]